MNEKELLKAREELDAKVVEIAKSATSGDLLQASVVSQLINEPYDAELPVPDVIAETCDIRRIPVGETTEYYSQDATTKTVYTVTNGSITQVNVAPGASSTLSMSVYESPEDYLYINDMLTQKYDSIALKGKDQHEGLNRKEQKDVIALFIAAAVSKGNTFVNDSGATKISFKKLVEMVRSLAKFGKNKFVLISGSAVSTDLVLMDYDDNKYREVSVEKAGITSWIKVENLTYEHSGTQTVMPTDKAIVVATSDAMDNRPAVFGRRQMAVSTGVDARERLTIVTGPRVQVGSAVKLAFSLITVESYGAAVTNANCFAVYQDAAIYS